MLPVSSALAQNSGHEPHLHFETIGLANRSRSSRVYSANKKSALPEQNALYCGRWVLKRTALVPIVREEVDLLPHRDSLYIIFVLGNLSVFSACPCMGGWVNFIFVFAGRRNIFVLGCAPYTPRPAPHRGYPRPLLLPAAGQPHKKEAPAPP